MSGGKLCTPQCCWYNLSMTNAAYEPMLAKLRRLPEPLVQEVEAFIDFLQIRWENQSPVWHSPTDTPAQNAPAEEGMDTYLRDLESYETLLAAGKITWR